MTNPDGLGFKLPSVSAQVDSEEDILVLLNQAKTIERGMVVPSNAVDPGGTPTTKLRKGLVLIRVEAAGANQGKFVPFGHADIPLTNDIQVATIILHYLSMLNENNLPEQKGAQGLVQGWVDEDNVIFGTADQPFIDKVKEVMTGAIFEANP